MAENVVTELAIKLASKRASKKETFVRWVNVSLHIRYSLQLNEFVDFVNSVVAECTRHDEDGEYVAYDLFDFSVRSNVVARYASVILPTDPRERYDILYSTDLYDTICEHICSGQLHAAIDTIKYYL